MSLGTRPRQFFFSFPCVVHWSTYVSYHSIEKSWLSAMRSWIYNDPNWNSTTLVSYVESNTLKERRHFAVSFRVVAEPVSIIQPKPFLYHLMRTNNDIQHLWTLLSPRQTLRSYNLLNDLNVKINFQQMWLFSWLPVIARRLSTFEKLFIWAWILNMIYMPLRGLFWEWLREGFEHCSMETYRMTRPASRLKSLGIGSQG